MQRADLESRQSNPDFRWIIRRIVQRADLESRQSKFIEKLGASEIVQRADLESRQSGNVENVVRAILCKERIWNQGKAQD